MKRLISLFKYIRFKIIARRLLRRGFYIFNWEHSEMVHVDNKSWKVPTKKDYEKIQKYLTGLDSFKYKDE